MRESFARVGVLLGTAGLMVLPLTSHAATRPHHHSSAHAAVHHSVSSHSSHTEHAYAGVTMSSERATQIQTALIQRGYLSGEPTGAWDSSSLAAMQRLQGDNGWQTKLVPDSRALIKLGLGPGTTSSTPDVTAAAPTTPTTVGTVTSPLTY